MPHAFEEPRYFEGCLPIEVMAERGAEVLAYGPMKPVGLEDPRTGQRPHAVVQLRREDVGGHGLQPRRLPDAAHLAGAAADLPRPSCPGLAERRVPAARADPPEHVRRGAAACSRPTSPLASGRTCSSRGKSPASRATSSPPPAGTSRRAPSCDRLAGRPFRAAARGDRAGRAPPTCHRRGPSAGVRLPADERRVRAVPAAHGAPPRQGRAQGGPRGAGAKGDRAVDRPVAERRRRSPQSPDRSPPPSRVRSPRPAPGAATRGAKRGLGRRRLRGAGARAEGARPDGAVARRSSAAART